MLVASPDAGAMESGRVNVYWALEMDLNLFVYIFGFDEEFFADSLQKERHDESLWSSFPADWENVAPLAFADDTGQRANYSVESWYRFQP